MIVWDNQIGQGFGAVGQFFPFPGLGSGGVTPPPVNPIDPDGWFFEEQQRRRRIIRSEEEELIAMATLVIPFLEEGD